MLITIGFFAFLTGLTGTFVAERIVYAVPILRDRLWDHPTLVFGFHIHHSLYGLVIAIVGLILLPWKRHRLATILIGFGLGVIVMHTISDGRLIFLE